MLKIANVFTSLYHTQTDRQLERYYRIVTAILRCYVDHHQQDWDANVSTLTYAYSRQVHRFAITRPLDPILNQKILNYCLKSTESTGKMLTTAKQWAGFLATLQHLLDRARASLQHTKELQNVLTDVFVRIVKGYVLATMCILMYWTVSPGHQSTCSHRFLSSVGVGPTNRGHPA